MTTMTLYHGNAAGALDGGAFDVSRAGSGALADAGKSHYAPAVYLTTSREHAAYYGTPLRVEATFRNPLCVNAVAQLEQWRRSEFSAQYETVQAMVDGYYDGEVYRAFNADEEFSTLARAAATAGHDAVVVDFGDLRDATAGRLGCVVLAVDVTALRVVADA